MSALGNSLPRTPSLLPALFLMAAVWVMACGGSKSTPGVEGTTDAPPPEGSRRGSAPAAPPAGIFADRTAELGVDFVHFNGMSGEYYMAEVTGVGVALLDYDNDGDLDLYLLQGNLLGPGKTMDDALIPVASSGELMDRLYRNDLKEDGRWSGFTDVTETSGLSATGYAMGVATGDFDNDGWTDLYVTNYGPNQMWRNRGDGTFEEVTSRTGTEDSRWSVPAAFFDYDRDGWLDLFVGNYIAASFHNRPICRDFTGAQDYCGPGSFKPEPDRLLRNRGDGTFEDVTAAAGIRQGFGGALGVVTADLNHDSWPDIYVANDGLPNNLWLGSAAGTFRDDALVSGCSVNGRGKAEASMGVDAADFDADGDLDLFMAHLTGETNTLYRNDGAGIFDDATIASGLGAPSRPYTSFGTAALDYDNDGWLDLVLVNGAVKKIEALARARDPFPLHQPNQLFRNLGAGRFEEVTAQAGPAFAVSEVSRGAAFGDLDNDGDTDVVIANNNGPARVLVNLVGQGRHWLGIRAVGRETERDLLGARVEVVRRDRPTLWRRVHTEGSFATAGDPRVRVGLGESPEVDSVRVHWPDGSVEAWTGLAVDRYTTLRQGSGTPVVEGDS